MKRDAPPPQEELSISPYKGKTGLRRIWNAFRYTLQGLAAAFRYEDASVRRLFWRWY